MLRVFVKVCCLCQCWCMEYAGCFWGFAVWIWSTWSSFVSCGILRGKFSECCARRWDALGERGARVGCGVGAMWHQAWPIKTARQKQSNNWWIHFSCILSISFVSVFPVSSTSLWTRHGFLRQRCKRGPSTLLHHMRCVGDEGAALWFDLVLFGWAWAGAMGCSVFFYLLRDVWAHLTSTPSIINYFESGGGLNGTQTQEINFLAGNVNVA